MPSPMPLVDPVTMATLPFNMGKSFRSMRNEMGRGSIAAMDVMGDIAELRCRRVDALAIGEPRRMPSGPRERGVLETTP